MKIKCYIENNNNNNNNNYPIEWMKIKSVYDNKDDLLVIPYTPLIKIANYETAIHKNISFIPNSKLDIYDNIIKDIYRKSKRTCFLKTFFKKIENVTDNKTKITLIIEYDPEKVNFTQLYFVNYLGRFGSFYFESEKRGILIFTTNKKELSK